MPILSYSQYRDGNSSHRACHAPPRTLDGIEEQYLFYLVSGSVRKQAQHFYNCIFEPIFNIPLEQVSKTGSFT